MLCGSTEPQAQTVWLTPGRPSHHSARATFHELEVLPAAASRLLSARQRLCQVLAGRLHLVLTFAHLLLVVLIELKNNIHMEEKRNGSVV